MANQTEPTLNAALGNLLQGMMQTYNVRSEHTGLITGQSGAQVDNLITAIGRSPVAVEAEFMPAHTAEDDAVSRLGKQIVGQPRPVEAVIALRYPADLKSASNLELALGNAQLSYCVLYDERDQDGERIRFPRSGWLEGGVEDLADLIRLVSIPEKAVNVAADSLQSGIEAAAVVLDAMAETQRHVVRSVADMLGMRNVPQTRRMACAIIANALIFHERIAGMHEGVNPLLQVCGPDIANPQIKTLHAWDTILKINYFPIFAIARDLLRQLPAGPAKQILDQLRDTAQEVDAAGVDNARDLTGRIFQRLISDRKYLASFYTRPASAALLARLAVAKLQDVEWSDPSAIASLRVGDFACGTGALLSAVYEEIAARHERARGDPAMLHAPMMEQVLYGCDVMPSAVHITGATLAGAQPNIGYQQSRLYTMPYGRQDDGSVQIGSLELLKASNLLTLFNTSDPALQTGSSGDQTAAQVSVDIPDGGFDLVIMNPPFTRATNHEGAHAEVVNPAVAAFDASDEDQTAMGGQINALGRNTCYHGNAGIASAFAALGHRKLRSGGVLALVLPLTAASGLSWRRFREMLAHDYTDMSVLSIASAGGSEMSFSSDTGMAECLVIARRAHKDEQRNHDTFTSLKHHLDGAENAHALALQLTKLVQTRCIEDGPYGGTPVYLGKDPAAETMSVAEHHEGPWGAVRIADYAIAQTAFALQDSRLWLQGSSDQMNLPTCQLKDIGRLGKVHRDITGPPPRGPFQKHLPSPTATYPSIWNHNHANEKRIVCRPDSQLLARSGMETQAAALWKTVSRCHINSDFTFGAQALVIAFTQVLTIGGRVWPNVQFDEARFDYALAVWGNSTLGLVSYWWHSSRQQSSKASMTIRSAESLPILDFRELSDEQLATAKDIFDDFRERDLQPAYLADADPNRAHLDRRVVCDLLGFDQSVYEGVRRLAAKWCAEPSVHGGKARPPDAALVI